MSAVAIAGHGPVGDVGLAVQAALDQARGIGPWITASAVAIEQSAWGVPSAQIKSNVFIMVSTFSCRVEHLSRLPMPPG